MLAEGVNKIFRKKIIGVSATKSWEKSRSRMNRRKGSIPSPTPSGPYRVKMGLLYIIFEISISSSGYFHTLLLKITVRVDLTFRLKPCFKGLHTNLTLGYYTLYKYLKPLKFMLKLYQTKYLKVNFIYFVRSLFSSEYI